MQQFQVPQFITVEDRIIGPLTFKQFVYLLGAAGAGLLGWFFLPLVIFLVTALPIAVGFVAMAFGKMNGRPIPDIIFSAITYYMKPRLYLWKHIETKTKKTSATPQTQRTPALAPRTTESRLRDLAWSLDIQEGLERAPDELSDIALSTTRTPLVMPRPHHTP